MADQVEDIREIVHPRLPRAEARIYRELRGAPEIGHRRLDLGIPLHPPRRGPEQPAAPLPPHLNVLLSDEYYGAAIGPRLPTRPRQPVQHGLVKLDVFKGENGERLDDFRYQVEEFAAFDAWDPVETCWEARTHLHGVALAYICRTPRVEGSADAAVPAMGSDRCLQTPFCARWRHQGEDIHAYVDAL